MDPSTYALCVQVGKEWAMKRVQVMNIRNFSVEDAKRTIQGLVPEDDLEEAAMLVCRTAQQEAINQDLERARKYRPS